MFKSPPPILAKFYVDGENQSVMVIVDSQATEHYVMSRLRYFRLRCLSCGYSPGYTTEYSGAIGVLEIAEASPRPANDARREPRTFQAADHLYQCLFALVCLDLRAKCKAVAACCARHDTNYSETIVATLFVPGMPETLDAYDDAADALPSEPTFVSITQALESH